MLLDQELPGMPLPLAMCCTPGTVTIPILAGRDHRVCVGIPVRPGCDR